MSYTSNWKNPQQAFKQAIESGRLSENPKAANYAGLYMYMGPNNQGQDAFKHINTRQYLPAY